MDSLIVSFLSDYQLPAIFLGAFFFGETVILTAAFLAGQGLWGVGNVVLLSLLGTLAADTLWFLFGKGTFRLAHRWEAYRRKFQPFVEKLDKVTGKRPFLALLFIKSLYGTRILTIIYLSARKIGLPTFLLFDALGTFLWHAVLIGVGWLAGKGVGDFSLALSGFQYALPVLLLVIVSFRLLSAWLQKRFSSG